MSASPDIERGPRHFFLGRNGLVAAALFLVALAVRLAYLAQIRGTPLTDVLLVDSETYDRFARRILDGTFRGEDVYSMNVLYPYFLAALYSIGDGSWTSALPVQAVLDAAAAVFTFFLGARFFGRAEGIVAGILIALYAPMVFYAGALLTPALVGFLTLAGLALVAAGGRRGGAWSAALAGAALGLAALGRGNAILLLPVGALHYGIASPDRARAVRRGALFAAVLLAFPLAATVRNYLVEGKVVPMAANYAAFYIGHDPDANGLYKMPSFVRSARFEGEVLGTRAFVSSVLGRPVTLAESAGVLFRWGVRNIAADPWGTLLLTAKKFYFFWNRTESPTNLNYHFARDFSSILRGLPFGFGIVAPLGIFGMIRAFRRRRELALLYLSIGVFLVTGLVFFVSAEYRLPAVPIVAFFAAHGVFDLAATARRRRAGSVLAAAGLLAALFVFTNHRTPLLAAQTWKRVDYLNFGVLYRDAERFDEARSMFERSLEIDPGFGPAHEAMGELLGRLGDDLGAAHHLALAERFALGGQYGAGPDAPSEEAGSLLAVAELYRDGKFDEALGGFEALADRFAREGNEDAELRARNNAGLCLYRLGRREEADRVFEEILRRNPAYVRALTNLAKVRVARGRPDEALRLYDRALSLDPNNPRIRDDRERLTEEMGTEGR